jgi:4-coumarate--CoA ligase
VHTRSSQSLVWFQSNHCKLNSFYILLSPDAMTIYTSPFPKLDIPEVDILSYVFPPGHTPSSTPLWIDSKDPSLSLSPSQLLTWVKRLAFGLERLGVKKGEVVMIYTPNHIFVPVAYLAIAGAGYAFSGANPIYTLPGEL